MATTTKVNPIAIFSPHPVQIAPWRDKAHVMLLTGSAGGGKSRLAAEKMHAFCKKYPNAMGLMLRKTRESTTNSIVLFMERTVIGDDPGVVHVRSKSRFEYANGSILAYGGMKNEEQREQIRSIGQEGGVDIAWMEEAFQFTDADYDEVITRMRGRAAGWVQIILSTNPDAPTHWIYQRLILGGEAVVYKSTAHDNPVHAQSYFDMLDMLTGVRRQRLRDGLWVQAEGAVYSDFDATVHVIDPFPIPDDWRRIRSIDFGYTNPFVCQWFAIDPDGRMYLYLEIYMTKRLVEDHAAQIRELTGEEYISRTVADHDAEDMATLRRHGVDAEHAQKAVAEGIQAVQERLRPAGDGKPRLYLMRGALVDVDEELARRKRPTCTLDEFPGYVWEPTRDGRPTKEAPLKLDDHGMDALRYAVMSEERPGFAVLAGAQRETEQTTRAAYWDAWARGEG